MKTHIMLSAILATLIAAPSLAAPPEKSGLLQQLADSRAKWEEAKQECGGNYSYQVRFTSFTGFGHETTIIVKKNKVQERHFHAFTGRKLVAIEPDGTEIVKDDDKFWRETGEDLGEHKEGAPPKTLDELYDEAERVVKEKAGEVHLRFYVKFTPEGLLLSCFCVDTRIADDAPRLGVALSSLTLEKPQPSR